METEEEFNFVKQALRFLPAHYHQRINIGGSSNEYVRTDGIVQPIDYSDYIPNNTGIMKSYD